MSTKQTLSSQVIADDFIDYAAKIEVSDKIVTAVVSDLSKETTATAATGSVASLVFYLRFNVTVKGTGGKSFTGDAGGLTSPGGGALIGDVYTDDMSKLYSDTVAFQFTCTPVYSSLLFFDKNHKLLGHFQAGSVSTVLGTGGGSGSWS